MFRLQSSSVILGRGSNYGVPEDATCDYLPACVTESEEGFSGKKKKQEKQMVDMSRVMSNLLFCIYVKNKGTDQLRGNCTADQRLCF